MHPVLMDSLKRLEQHFADDARCLAMYLWGSAGDQTADEFSDIDVALIVSEEDIARYKAEARSVCEALFGTIRVWLPEGDSTDYVNYAFLFDAGPDLLLYDLCIATPAAAARRASLRPGTILFDRTGLFLPPAPAQAAPLPAAPPAAETLMQTIHAYWVYMYLNGKYLRRSDIFKLLYVQETLFQSHLRLLRCLYPEMQAGWWVKQVQALPPEEQEPLLIYFGAAAKPSDIAAALPREMDLFSSHARKACEQTETEYPSALEQAVRQHLARAGVVIKVPDSTIL